MVIAEIVKAMAEELKNDNTARISEVKERADDLEKNMADKALFQRLKNMLAQECSMHHQK